MILCGESYAGHWIPAFARNIIEDFQANDIPLVGIMIGDGLHEAQHQQTYSQLGFSAGLLDKKT